MYPDNVDQFTAKLNKKQDGSLYIVEEILTIKGGVYEGFLEHDNITDDSIKVYTGTKLTGDEVTNVLISIPLETPWKRKIKIFTDICPVYVSYTTPGDTVEADDINEVQRAITETQIEIERYKTEGHIDGGTF